jgi:hypothetical protein
MPKPVISICVTLTMLLIGLVVLNKAVTVMKKENIELKKVEEEKAKEDADNKELPNLPV